MGGFFKDINDGGMIMQLLYLNDWSMQGGGSLTSQWSKVERWYEAIESPMWNQDMMKAYCEKIGHTANRKSATTGEKISYLRTHGGILAVMNGWIVDENKTKLNQNKDHQRLIFRSAHFKEDNCYLSIDFEKEDFHYELLDHRGKHIKEINWHGNQTGGKDPTHNILIKKV